MAETEGASKVRPFNSILAKIAMSFQRPPELIGAEAVGKVSEAEADRIQAYRSQVPLSHTCKANTTANVTIEQWTGEPNYWVVLEDEGDRIRMLLAITFCPFCGDELNYPD